MISDQNTGYSNQDQDQDLDYWYCLEMAAFVDTLAEIHAIKMRAMERYRSLPLSGKTASNFLTPEENWHCIVNLMPYINDRLDLLNYVPQNGHQYILDKEQRSIVLLIINHFKKMGI